MERITIDDVHATFHQLKAIYPKANNWELEDGSPVNGKAWRIYRNPGKGDVFGQSGFIGNTAREAYESLKWLVRGIQLERGIFHIRDNEDNRA